MTASDPPRLDPRALIGGELTDDALTATYRVFQLRRGHRYSIDDVVTAYEAVRSRPSAARALDLGTGLGSVLIMLAYKLRSAALDAIEAQDASFELANRNVARNGLAGRVALVHGDFRDPGVRARLRHDTYELITGTPPYLPPESGTPSPCSQRTHARLEMRGGVEAYVRVAAERVAAGGRIVVCAPAGSPERVERSCAEVGLVAIRRVDVSPRRARKPFLFSCWTLAPRREVDPEAPLETATLYARDEHGARTEEAHALRRFFGLVPRVDEPASP